MKDERFHRGIQEFNDGRYFEAHDILEDLWHEYREEDRLFLQGLIQLAVGYYHLENRNYNGSRSLLRKGIAKLSAYVPKHHGIQVENLIRRASECLERIECTPQGEAVAIPRSLIPTITYSESSNEPSSP